MPAQINSNYSANFQKFVDFANKAYDTKGVKGADTVVRFEGAPAGDYKGTFASFLRTSEMKTANDRVRDLFLKTVADMFGGEKFIPDLEARGDGGQHARRRQVHGLCKRRQGDVDGLRGLRAAEARTHRPPLPAGDWLHRCGG